MKSKIILCIVLLLFVVALIGCKNYTDSIKEPKTSDFTYAIIYYPDMKYSIEGYVDYYIVWSGDIIQISIDGTTYYVNSKNCIIIKNKDLKVNKEVKNE